MRHRRRTGGRRHRLCSAPTIRRQSTGTSPCGWADRDGCAVEERPAASGWRGLVVGIDARGGSGRLVARSCARMVDRRAVRRSACGADFAARHGRDFPGRIRVDGVALVVRQRDHSVGRQIAILPAGAVSRDLDRARRMAVVDAAMCSPAGRRFPIHSRCLFSPLHVLLAAFNPAISLRAFDAVIFVYLCLGGIGIILFFRDRGWHAGGAVVAALAFALGGAASARVQHIGQVISLAYLPLVLWLLARALERSSWRAGLAAGAIAGLMAIGRDQVALLSPLCGRRLSCWPTGSRATRACSSACARACKPLSAAAVSGALVAAVPVIMTDAAGGALEPSRGQLRLGGRRLDPSGAPAADSYSPICSGRWTRRSHTGRRRARSGTPPGAGRDFISRRTCRWFMPARCRSSRSSSFGLIRGVAFARDIRFLHDRGGADAALRARLLYAGVPPDVRTAVRLALSPGRRRHLRAAARLLAIVAGYLVHRWLSGTVPAATRVQRALEIACAIAFVAAAFAVAAIRWSASNLRSYRW